MFGNDVLRACEAWGVLLAARSTLPRGIVLLQAATGDRLREVLREMLMDAEASGLSVRPFEDALDIAQKVVELQ